jgi:site-specific DNA-methyltransferase (cytosine-N4-specific)
VGLTPFFHDDHLTVYQGDCREVMAEMEPESVHCVVTSPPYWGLRDYGTATWVGGDEGCDHLLPGGGPKRGLNSDGHRRRWG